jgi:hypothetical protein
VDIRPLPFKIPNVTFHQADINKDLNDWKECTDAVSSLHVVEHIGLGRYGDTIDPEGHIKCLQNITSMLKPGGIFFFSTPIGPERIEFNAHRVFSLRCLHTLLTKNFDILDFGIVTDENELLTDIKLNDELLDNNCGQYYGCGLFVLRKRTST